MQDILVFDDVVLAFEAEESCGFDRLLRFMFHQVVEVDASARMNLLSHPEILCYNNVITIGGEKMRVSVTKIGNSKGVIIPAKVLQECHFEDKANLEVRNGRLILSADKKPRDGWEEIFARQLESGDDKLLMAEFPNEFDDEEWVW